MKYDVRLAMVLYARQNGNKPAARQFGCTVKIVRKWRTRYEAANGARSALQDRSRAPKTCPHKTPARQERQVVRARLKAKCLGARRLKEYYALKPSVGAISRILRQAGLTRKRKKKQEKKRDMRQLKARLQAFEQAQVDVKYLTDIPFYVEQLWSNKALPRFQYSWRDVRTGGLFLGFANELSEEHACCFVAAVGAHLKRIGQPLNDSIVQTDNGVEFSGAERKIRDDRGFHYTVQKILGAHHRFIPPGRKNHQADVETIHERIEAEFFDLERFASRQHFFLKASAWQLWWNTTRKNSYKNNQTPHQILASATPRASPNVWLLPALDLDQAMKLKRGARGYHLPELPALQSLRLLLALGAMESL